MLTISACSTLRGGAVGAAGLSILLLAACTIEVGPPPETDPPLVPEAQKAPPAPPQPTEPQPWARGLDFDSVPAAHDRERLAKGLVPANVEPAYSGERLTFESAFNPERLPSEAAVLRQRAQLRAREAGLPPPPALGAVPVTEVEAKSLDAVDSANTGTAPRRESRLPPPPKFPPLPAEKAAAAPEAAPGPEPEASRPAKEPEPWEARNSRLPAPPKLPPVQPAAGQTAAATPVEPASETPAPVEPAGAEAATFVAEAWNPPPGTILVQVSAVPDNSKVAEEWERLKARYPQVLKPLRLAVEEARLGDRGVLYRVQAGAFGTQAAAAAACDSLISQGQACFVVVR